ncbi:MAG TPA: alpha/beta hydrolase [Pseudonocardia sp.]|nr:alpha/beta hydrolase [Pseudonocardia sp.]
MPTVVRAGVETYYEERGAGEQVLVWGHGFLVSSRSLIDVIDRLPGYRSIAVDFRGHGRSNGVTEGITLAEIADDIAAVLDELKIDNVIYIGHSTGSAVGMRLAARHPGLVRAAVGLAGVPVQGNPPETLEFTSALTAMQGDPAAFAGAFAQITAHPGQEGMVEAASRDAALLPPEALKSIGEAELFLDEADELLPKLTQPWLFVIPGDDKSLPADLQLAGARRFTNGRALWLNGEGHMVPQERPAEIARIVGDFVAGLPSAT